MTNTCNQEVEETGQQTIIDDFTGEEYIYVANVVQEEEQESSSGSIIFYLLLILFVLILIIVCYIFYKRHEKATREFAHFCLKGIAHGMFDEQRPRFELHGWGRAAAT